MDLSEAEMLDSLRSDVGDLREDSPGWEKIASSFDDPNQRLWEDKKGLQFIVDQRPMAAVPFLLATVHTFPKNLSHVFRPDAFRTIGALTGELPADPTTRGEVSLRQMYAWWETHKASLTTDMSKMSPGQIEETILARIDDRHHRRSDTPVSLAMVPSLFTLVDQPKRRPSLAPMLAKIHRENSTSFLGDVLAHPKCSSETKVLAADSLRLAKEAVPTSLLLAIALEDRRIDTRVYALKTLGSAREVEVEVEIPIVIRILDSPLLSVRKEALRLLSTQARWGLTDDDKKLLLTALSPLMSSTR
jgi:hypothetical protein